MEEKGKAFILLFLCNAIVRLEHKPDYYSINMLKFITPFLFILLVSSGGNKVFAQSSEEIKNKRKKIYYNKDERDWESRELPSGRKLVHAIYLIGDAGKPSLDPVDPNLKLLNKHLMQAGKDATVVFLGDNIYPAGLPNKDAPDRKKAEKYLIAQLDAVKDFKGNIYFIPGNHDWNEFKVGGRDAVLRQEKFIEKYLDRKGVMKPGDACGDPKAVELEKDLTLILIDSHWFLHDWSKEPEMNKGCKIKTRHEFQERIEELIDEYDNGRILIALHHPLYSNGEHGGYFSLRDHIFPLTPIKKNLYIPLPILGSIAPLVRYLGISNQEIAHPQNKELVDILLDATFKKGNIIFASGHEHNLQYFNEGSVISDRHYIVSGSGSKENYFRKTPDVDFAYGGNGFARLLYYDDGATWLEMIRPVGDGSQEELLFRREVKSSDLSVSKSINPAPLEIDSVFVAADQDSIYLAGKGKEVMLGSLYRNVWVKELKLPILDLSQVHGGLIPVKKGGGFQTQSLRLQAPDKSQYVLRSVAKDVSLVVDGFFSLPKRSFLRELAQDFIAMSHPYSAWVVPPLADAAGVYHTNPKFYYVPKQPSLGDFSESFGDQVFLFEERPTKNMSETPTFGNAEDFESTPTVIRELHNSAKHRVDQQMVLRSRLFDLFLGDWDRHDDQWRWAVFEDGDITTYRPIPRDRDQAFAIVNGFLPWLITREWAIRHFHNFQEDTRDIQGLSRNARWFDRSFLTEKDKNQWLAMADSLKHELTNEVIESAVRTWPKEIYDLHGEDIIRKLKARRDRLPEFAARYYKYLALNVDVLGSDNRERFEITRIEPHQTRVVVYRLNKDMEKKEVIYERVFLYPETKEVRLHGLAGRDEFIIKGKSTSGSLLRIVGGRGEDVVVDESRVGGGKRTVVYDSKTGNELILGSEGRNKTSDDEGVNSHDRKSFILDSYIPIVLPGYNLDDGFTIGAGVIKTKHGFRKKPYRLKTDIFVNYAFETKALSARYKADFIHAFGKWDFMPSIKASAPTFVVNYFGLGNNTSYTDTTRNFNRVRMSTIDIFPAFKKTFNNQQHTFLIGPQYNFNQVEETDDRFVSTSNANLNSEDFEVKNFLGVKLAYNIDAVDNPALPSRGVRFNFETAWRTNLDETSRSYTSLNTDFSVYYTAYWPTLITLGTRVGYGKNWGEYEFFQAQTLGRRTNLRGYRGERFAGDAAFFHNTDIRIRLFKVDNYFIPFDIGLIGFFDHGRVWYEEDDPSKKWHQGSGGGLVISPLNTAIITATYSISEEFNIFEVRFGFFF